MKKVVVRPTGSRVRRKATAWRCASVRSVPYRNVVLTSLWDDVGEAAHLHAGDGAADTAPREADVLSDRGEGQAVVHDRSVAQGGARGEHAGT